MSNVTVAVRLSTDPAYAQLVMSTIRANSPMRYHDIEQDSGCQKVIFLPAMRAFPHGARIITRPEVGTKNATATLEVRLPSGKTEKRLVDPVTKRLLLEQACEQTQRRMLPAYRRTYLAFEAESFRDGSIFYLNLESIDQAPRGLTGSYMIVSGDEEETTAYLLSDEIEQLLFYADYEGKEETVDHSYRQMLQGLRPDFPWTLPTSGKERKLRKQRRVAV
jgi:hypothetical protein